MSSSDYIALRRLRRTVGNSPYMTSNARTEYVKLNTIQCIYNINDDTTTNISFFDITPEVDFTDCLSIKTYTTSTTPVLYKPDIIHTPVYVKNQTIQRKCCCRHPTLRGGCSRPVLLRVCKCSNTDN
jgi:hypothetical protein